MRNLLYLLLLGSLVALVFYWFYRGFDESTIEKYDTLIAVPQRAALIIETADAADLWRDLSQNNLMWEELRATDFFFRLNELGLTLDSLIREQEALRTYLSGRPVAVSIHASGAKGFNYLFTLQVEPNVPRKELHEAISGLFNFEASETRLYGGENLITFNSPYIDGEFHYYYCRNSLVFSASEILLEESVRAMKQGASVLNDAQFSSVRKTVDESVRAHVFLNYREFKRIGSQYLSSKGREASFFKKPFAEWSALDLSLKANAVHLNGFVLAPDSSDAWLAAFAGVDAPAPDLIDYLPANTAYFLFTGFGDYRKYREEQLIRLEKANQRFSMDRSKREMDERCNCDSEKLASYWISREAVSLITEPASGNYAQNHLALFRTEDAEAAISELRKLAVSLGADPDQEEDVMRLPVGHFYGEVISDALSGLVDPYVTHFEDIVVMANSKNALRSYLSAIRANRTFKDSKDFPSVREQLFLDAHVILYNALARSPDIFKNLLADPYGNFTEDQVEVIRNFGAFIYQVSHSNDDLFYNGISLLRAESYEPETGSLWEVKLSSPVIGDPFLVENHYTRTLEILVQDADLSIHLISSNGKVLWNQQIEGPIAGSVHQVDVYKNKKLQMLFNTGERVYLLDRNGNKVEEFPVKLPAVSTASVSVADYDGSRDYRYFIPVTGGNIICLDAYGRRVEGWNYQGDDDIIVPIEHLRIGKKDYLFTLTENDEVLLLNRRGGIRHETGRKAEGFYPGTYHMEVGQKSIAECALYYADSLGTMCRLGFDGSLEKVSPGDTPLSDYAVADLNDDGTMDFVFLRSGELAAYSFSGEVLFEVDIDASSECRLSIHRYKDQIRVAVADEEGSRIFMFDSKGKRTPEIPLYGIKKPAIGDINLNGYPNLITADESGSVYSYSIE